MFVVEDDAARLRPVEIGARYAHAAEIVSGLAPGETVILHPSDRIGAGTPVADRALMAAP